MQARDLDVFGTNELKPLEEIVEPAGPPPVWMGAWDTPWACVRNAVPRVLDTTEVCAVCPRWEPQPAIGAGPPAGQAARGAVDV